MSLAEVKEHEEIGSILQNFDEEPLTNEQPEQIDDKEVVQGDSVDIKHLEQFLEDNDFTIPPSSPKEHSLKRKREDSPKSPASPSPTTSTGKIIST